MEECRGFDLGGEDATSILLLVDPSTGMDDDACIALLQGGDSGETNVLGIITTVDPDNRLILFKRGEKQVIAERISVIDARGMAGPAPQEATSEEVDASIELLPSDAELVDLSMTVARQIGLWESNDESTRLCVHSLSTLFDVFDRHLVIGFVNAINDLCETTDSVGHHHLDPTAHDDEVVSVLRPLYDVVIEQTDDDELMITRSDTDVEPPSFRGSTTPPGGTAAEDSAVGREAVPMPRSFDIVLDAISVPRRRTILYHLKDRTDHEIPLDDLVERIVERESAIPVRTAPESRDDVKLSLVHRDLPKLEDVGIVSFDADEKLIRYTPNPALEAALDYLETLELG